MRRISARLQRGGKLSALTLAIAMLSGVSAQADDYAAYFANADDCIPCPPSPCLPSVIETPHTHGMVPTDLPESSPGDVPATPLPNIPSSEIGSENLSQWDVNQFNNAIPSTVASAPSASLVASNTNSFSDTPDLVGDSFLPSLTYSFGSILNGNVAIGGGDRRIKTVDNVSPVPGDRVFMTYNHFHNAATSGVNAANSDPVSIDRYMLGFEKTFFNKLASFEFRMPFSGGLDSTQTGIGDGEACEFGNIGLALKANLISGEDFMLSAGALLTLPTADDFVLPAAVLTVENTSVQLAPFIAFLHTYGDDWFTQGMAQVSFDLGGYEGVANGESFVVQEQALMFLSGSLGRWIYRRENRGILNYGLATMAELHYTGTLDDADNFTTLNGVAFSQTGGINILNATGALHFQAGKTTLRVGASAPLRDGTDKAFDTEVFVQMNRYF